MSSAPDNGSDRRLDVLLAEAEQVHRAAEDLFAEERRVIKESILVLAAALPSLIALGQVVKDADVWRPLLLAAPAVFLALTCVHMYLVLYRAKLIAYLIERLEPEIAALAAPGQAMPAAFPHPRSAWEQDYRTRLPAYSYAAVVIYRVIPTAQALLFEAFYAFYGLGTRFEQVIWTVELAATALAFLLIVYFTIRMFRAGVRVI